MRDKIKRYEEKLLLKQEREDLREKEKGCKIIDREKYCQSKNRESVWQIVFLMVMVMMVIGGAVAGIQATLDFSTRECVKKSIVEEVNNLSIKELHDKCSYLSQKNIIDVMKDG